MDPLSLTASIIAIIQLSSEVVGSIGAATGATKERRRLREEVLACDTLLQELKDEADDSEEGAAWSKTIKALEGPDAPLGRLSIALKLVRAKLEPQKGRKIRTSLRWPFEGKEVEKIIGAIEREKALLNLALNNDHRRLTQDLKRVAKENTRQLLELANAVEETSKANKEQFVEVRKDLATIEKLQTRLSDGIDHLSKSDDDQKEEKEKEDILNWLTSIDYSSQQSDFINRRTPGTGHWLLDSAEFREWVDTDSKILFCPGIPGAGKTILTSIVVEELYERFRSRDVEDGTSIGIAYMYCNFLRRNDQTAYGILASLLKQLCQETASLPEVVRGFYEKYRDRRIRPSINAVSTTLQAVVRGFSRVFIILDALDECQTSDGCRTNVLTEIFRLSANIFATSRPVPEITEKFSQSIHLEISAKDDDVGMYLDGHMYRLPGFVASNPSLQEEIKSTITRLVQGMFLLAQLYTDSLVGKRSPKAVRLALADLPTGSTAKAYDFAYEHAMERIEGQLADQEQLAKQVLSWIVCAERPLTAKELQHALAVELEELELDEENIPQLEDLISVCAGVVTHDEKSRIIRLVHYTAQEYFDRTRKRWFPDAEAELMMKCVTYLSRSIFGNGPCRRRWSYRARERSNPLFNYAALHWGNHSRKSLSTCPEVKRLLESPWKVDAFCQVLQVASLGRGSFVTTPPRMTRLHLAAYFGLPELVEEFLIEGLDFDLADSLYMTPLGWAARNGHTTVIQRLLNEYGVCENFDTARYPMLVSWVTQKCLPPIFWAVENGNEKLTELLLGTDGVNPDAQDLTTEHLTPLFWAVKYRHGTIVKLLLETTKVDADRGYRGGNTLLSLAARSGDGGIVKLLLETENIDVNKKDDEGLTPLACAASKGHDNVVKILLETENIDVNRKDDGGMTPLALAVLKWPDRIVKLLLQNAMIDVSKEGVAGMTPLALAALKGRVRALKFLLQNETIDVNKKDDEGMTPLALAARDGRVEVVKLLLETGKIEIDQESTCVCGETPLSFAIQGMHLGIMKLLLQYGTNPEEKRSIEILRRLSIDELTAVLKSEAATFIIENEHKLNQHGSWSEMALVMASQHGRLSKVMKLLDKGVHPNASDGFGRSLLSWALQNNRLHLAECLIQKGASINAEGRDGWTPLWHAVQSGNGRAVKWLLDHKADPNADGSCEMMVRWAAREGFKEIVRLLLTFGDLETTLADECAKGALVAAAKQGQAAVVKLLLDMGVDANSVDEKGKTALYYATLYNCDAVIKFLRDHTS